MLTSIRYVLLCALRDKLFVGLVLAILIATLLASLLGSTAFLEEREMTLAFAGASARLILAIGLIVFVCFHIRSGFESREIDVMLSRPISRPQLAIAYWLGFATVSSLLVLPVAAALLFIGPLSWSGLAHFIFSLLLETWFVVALALFAALTLKSAVASVMATLGLYVMSRMMAFFVMSADAPAAGQGMITLAKYILKSISTMVPRLDFYAATEWLIYGIDTSADWQRYVIQSAIFIPLLICACVLDFRRKQF